MVAEKGAYRLDGHFYMITSGPYTRTTSNLVAGDSNFIDTKFVQGCGGATVY
jgi:hypothetical protein